MKVLRQGNDWCRQDKRSLSHLYHLAQLDAQHPGNIGAGLKVMEMLLNLPGFRPSTGSKA